MIASMLYLNRNDIKTLRITDPYSIHRVVYGLFEDVRSDNQKQMGAPSGIQYVDKGGDAFGRKILMLSDRNPINIGGFNIQSKLIPTTFLLHDRYRFEVTINPAKRDHATRKIVPIKGREAIAHWFEGKSSVSWGFVVNSLLLQIIDTNVVCFKKGEHDVTHGSATLIGELTVVDRDKFTKSFQKGIGRGRAFGLGLLQVVPL